MTESDLSGFIDSLSGRVNTVEAHISEALQKLLLRVDIPTLSNFQNIVTTQLDSFGNAQTNHTNRLSTIEGLYSNLAFDFLEHLTVFSGHTGTTGVHFTES